MRVRTNPFTLAPSQHFASLESGADEVVGQENRISLSSLVLLLSFVVSSFHEGSHEPDSRLEKTRPSSMIPTSIGSNWSINNLPNHRDCKYIRNESKFKRVKTNQTESTNRSI